MFYRYMQATRNAPEVTNPFAAAIAQAHGGVATKRVLDEGGGDAAKKSKTKEAKRKADKVKKKSGRGKKKKKRKKVNKSKKQSSSSGSGSSSSSSSGSSSGSIGKVRPVQPLKAKAEEIEADPRRYFLSPEELKRQELRAKARADRMQTAAAMAQKLACESTRREEDWRRRLLDGVERWALDSAQQLVEAAVGKSAKAVRGARGLPLRAITRQRVLSWIWEDELEEYIGGGADDPDETLS